MNESDLAEDLSWVLHDVYFELNRRYVVDEYVMGLISRVIRISQHFETLIMKKNHRLKKEESIKIEAIAGLSNKLETLVESGELKSEGREKDPKNRQTTIVAYVAYGLKTTCGLNGLRKT